MISEEIVSEGSIHRCGSIPSSSHPALGNHNLISVSVFTFSKMSVDCLLVLLVWLLFLYSESVMLLLIGVGNLLSGVVFPDARHTGLRSATEPNLSPLFFLIT